MSALAQLLHERGDHVFGSDREESPVTELLRKKGIEVTTTQDGSMVTDAIDMLVYSDAVCPDNLERVRAEELGITQLSYFEMLGSASVMQRTIAVAGTHGKTTTTGMLARILRDNGANPSAIVGSIVRDFGSNYLAPVGTSDLLVVEACEYKRHFLNLTPEILVVTNIEFDHSDYFDDLKDVQSAFRALMEKVPHEGTIVTDVEHPNIAPLLVGLSCAIVDYTQEPAYPLRLPGDFNLMNARAAARGAKVVLPKLMSVEINRSLEAFEGTWRRFEYKGKTKQGAVVYDDYAHHPTAIKETLRALKTKTTGRIFVAFHPHLYSRTRDLLDGFSRAFGDASEVLIAPIYAAREVDDGTISNEILAEHVRSEGGKARALSFKDIEDVLNTEPQEGDVIMTMGAGDIYKIADALTT